MKLRMRFEKGDAVKFISHLDMLRVFERAMRRANLPVAFSQGFNPRPKVSFTPALSVGVTSSGEYMDIELSEEIDAQEMLYRLNRSLPKGLRVIEAGYAKDISLSALNCAIYLVDVIIQDTSKQAIDRALRVLLGKKEILLEKKSKSKTKLINIAPLIYNICIVENIDDKVKFSMELAIGQQGSTSPQQVIAELEKILSKEIIMKKVHRRELFLKKDEEKLFPL